MKKIPHLFLFVPLALVIGCSEPDAPIEPENPLRKIELADFVGEWVAFVNEKPYEKIVISGAGPIYEFKYFVKLSDTFNIHERYEEQDLSNENFIPYSQSSFFIPYLKIKSSYSTGTTAVHYKIVSGKHKLSIGVTDFFKQ